MRKAHSLGGRATKFGVLGAMLAFAAGCSTVTDSLLEAEDPDLILPPNTRSAAGAIAVANGALGRLRNITGGSESTWLFGGLLVDEWGTSSTFIQNDETDWRQIQVNNSTVTGMLRRLYQVRTYADLAIPLLREFQPTQTTLIAEMYFARGIAELQLASDFCNGIPLSEGATDPIVYGDPLTVSKVFDVAIASFDSALTLTTGTDAQSVLVANAARVGKARALMGNNRYSDAAAAVASVPTSFRYQTTFSLATSANILWDQPFSQNRYTVADSVEGNSRNLLVKNAIPFCSAKDPRVPCTDTKLTTPRTGQDGGTIIRTTTRFGRLSAVDVVSGIDARLIEAEAALKANDVTTWLSKLNGLRSGGVTQIDSVTLTATSLPPLTDPGAALSGTAATDARINLTFRERAFWTFSHGQRLGDLRRLVRQYGRSPQAVFPEGQHYKTSVYGSDVNLPVIQDEQNNPKFKECLDRSA